MVGVKLGKTSGKELPAGMVKERLKIEDTIFDITMSPEGGGEKGIEFKAFKTQDDLDLPDCDLTFAVSNKSAKFFGNYATTMDRKDKIFHYARLEAESTEAV